MKVLSLPGGASVYFYCNETKSMESDGLVIHPSTRMNVFMESGGDNPDYFQAGPNEAVGSVGSYASVDGDSFHVQAQGSFGVLTLEIATVDRGSDCHVQAQGLLTT